MLFDALLVIPDTSEGRHVATEGSLVVYRPAIVSRMATLHRVPRLFERHMCIRYEESMALSWSVVVHCM